MGSIFFASDFHLKSGNLESADRELRICRWLNSVSNRMDALYLVGDVFDFWFDYKNVIPRGYMRLFACLHDLRDQKIPIYFFTGNHDLWMKDFFLKEFGIPIYHEPQKLLLQNKEVWIGHGDGLGPGDHGYKFIKKVFTNPLAQILFRWIHPDLGIGMANYFSSKSREAQDDAQIFLGADKEWLIQYCEEQLQFQQPDYFIFGHRHLPIDYRLSNQKSRYINLGDWMQFNSFAEMTEGQIQVKFFENEVARVFP